MRALSRMCVLVSIGLALAIHGLSVQAQSPAERCAPPGSAPIIVGEVSRVQPILTEAGGPPPVNVPQPASTDQPLPINLATALRLAGDRPLVIAAAQAEVEVAAGRLQQARALWLPTVYAGADYQRHDGGFQDPLTGGLIINGRSQFLAGAGAKAVFAVSDAIYQPLAAQQTLQARQIAVQSATNEALLETADTYFRVQQARGRLAGYQDSVAKGRELVRRVEGLGRGLVPPIEADRARATLANLEQQAELARAAWRVSSAELARVLRLNPTAVVVPLEPPHLLVTLISPEASVDSLVAIGLAYRPDLASHQALVQASSMRLRQEQVRPFIPSVVLQGSATPGESLGAGVYGAGLNALDHWAGRSDWDMSVLWELKNLGFGNRGLITERRGQQQQAVVEMLRAQDRVAAEVVQAHALMLAAAHRIPQAEADVRSAVVSYTGNLRGLGETIRVGDVLQLVTRPEEAVQALIQLQQAYNNYYAAVNDYNRSQFRLYYALGYPAQGLTNQPAGP